jgi:GntR family transcriptional regulator
MNNELNAEKPIFVQIAEKIEESILDGSLQEGDQVPSTNELAKFYQINPATAGKGINLLVDQNILFKKRGIGMFVAEGARETILTKRKSNFFQDFIIPLKKEAEKLGITTEEIIQLLLNKE